MVGAAAVLRGETGGIAVAGPDLLSSEAAPECDELLLEARAGVVLAGTADRLSGDAGVGTGLSQERHGLADTAPAAELQ